MSDATTARGACFESLLERSLHVHFDQPCSSSEGGAVILKAADEKLGLSAALAAALRDRRDPRWIALPLIDLERQRVFAIASGYADGNDAARLIDDPMARLVLGRDPLEGAPIASQPTLSRFENAIDGRSLVRLGHVLADTVIARHALRRGGKARRITIDLGPTDDATRGAQQLASFNGYYDGWCYLPVAGFVSFDDEPEQCLVSGLLRAGDARAGNGAEALLRRLFARRSRACPAATLRVRLDGGFASAALFEFLEHERVEYVVAMQRNAALAEEASEATERVRRRSFESGESERECLACRYEAQT